MNKDTEALPYLMSPLYKTMYDGGLRSSHNDFWMVKIQARTHNGHRKHGHKKQRGTRK